MSSEDRAQGAPESARARGVEVLDRPNALNSQNERLPGELEHCLL